VTDSLHPPVFSAACPACAAEFPIDPRRVPGGSVHAVCSACLRAFLVSVPSELLRHDEEAGADWKGAAARLPEEALAPDAPMASAPDVLSEPPFHPVGGLEEAPDTPFEDLTGLATEARSESSGSAGGLSDSPGTTTPLADNLLREVAGKTLSQGADRFGRRDPIDRARRLARVLVSDILSYYPVRYQESRARGTLREDFADEVRKSWREYVDQVGEEVARSTPFFDEALAELFEVPGDP